MINSTIATTIRTTIKLVLASCLVPALLPTAGCARAEGVGYRRHLSVVSPAASDEVLAAWPQPQIEAVTMADGEE